MADPIASGQQIGEGWAQVFKPYEDKYADKINELTVKKKEEQDKTAKGIASSLGALDKIDILPGDQKMFADMQKDIYDYSQKNIDALRKGDPDATMNFQRKLTDYQNKAAHSKDYREQNDKIGFHISTNSDKFDPNWRTNWLSDASSSFNPDGSPKSVDITKYSPKQAEFNDVEFWNKALDTYKPSAEKRVVEDPLTGKVVTHDNEFYNDPNAIAKDLLGNQQYYEKVFTTVNSMPEEQRKALQEKSLKEGGSGNTYVEYTKDEFLKRKGLKQEGGVRFDEQKKPEEATNVNFSNQNGSFSTKKFNYNYFEDEIPSEQYTQWVTQAYQLTHPNLSDADARAAQQSAQKKVGNIKAKTVEFASVSPGENKSLKYPLLNGKESDTFIPKQITIINGKEYLVGQKLIEKEVTDPATKEVKTDYDVKDFFTPMYLGLRNKISVEYDNFLNEPGYKKWKGSSAAVATPQSGQTQAVSQQAQVAPAAAPAQTVAANAPIAQTDSTQQTPAPVVAPVAQADSSKQMKARAVKPAKAKAKTEPAKAATQTAKPKTKFTGVPQGGF